MLICDLMSEKELDLFCEEEQYDSDKIDSDVEAELYSVIHYMPETSVPVSDNNEPEAETINNNDANLKEFDVFQIENFSFDGAVNMDLDKSFDSPKKKDLNYQQPNDNSFSSKRKSVTITDVLNHIQSSSKKLKKVQNSDPPVKKKKITPLINNSDDSDSDIIWTEPDEKEKSLKNFCTNISQHTILISSDSDNSDSFNFSNKSLSDVSLNTTKTKDSWYINDEDLYRAKKIRGRYHDSRCLSCSNCNQKGHVAKFCPKAKAAKCFVCGNQHKVSKCKNKPCIKCFRMGHDESYCPRRIVHCSCCGLSGHFPKECPDRWRKYHLTTGNKFVKSRRLFQNTPLYCYNCGLEGHFGAKCIKSSNHLTCFPTWPSIINLDVPKEFSKSMKNINDNLIVNNNQVPESSPKPFGNLRQKVSLTNKKKKKKPKKGQLCNEGSNQNNLKSMYFPRTPKANKGLLLNNEESILKWQQKVILRREERKEIKKLHKKINNVKKKLKKQLQKEKEAKEATSIVHN